jgi:hypothetical protein
MTFESERNFDWLKNMGLRLGDKIVTARCLQAVAILTKIFYA